MKMVKVEKMTAMLLLVMGCSRATGFSTYNDNYSEENYEYNYNEVEEVEQEANFLPVFLSSPTVYRVVRGNTARLECKVERLEPMILSWRRVINNSSEYIATGKMVLVKDKRVSVLTSTTSSMLLITLITAQDLGEYVCEVSSTPPVHMKHWLKMKAAPRVAILGKPRSGVLTIQAGAELGLVCRGSGEPAPTLAWRREGEALPGGEKSMAADQIIYSSVAREHAGTYTCLGDNGAGRVARDSVTVQVKYAPVISVDQTYIHHPTNISLELVCSVQSYPVASVQWSRKGEEEQMSMDRTRVDLREQGKHVLILESPKQSDLGEYECAANNSEGKVIKTIRVQGPLYDPTEKENLSEKATAVIDESENTSKSPSDGESDIETLLNKEKDNHKLLKHILHRINKFETVNRDIVKAMKESNRYLFRILSTQNRLLDMNWNGTDQGGGYDLE